MSSPSGVRGEAPAASAFLAYLKPTGQPIKRSIFCIRPLSRSIRGHGYWTIRLRCNIFCSSGGHSGLAGEHGPLGYGSASIPTELPCHPHPSLQKSVSISIRSPLLQQFTVTTYVINLGLYYQITDNNTN